VALSLLPQGIGGLDEPFAGAGQEHDAQARIVRRARDAQPAEPLHRAQVPAQRRPVNHQDVGQGVDVGSALPEPGHRDQHGELRCLDPGMPQGVVVDLGQRS
jgi:hypothetical protein